jgi:hypothetical protein
VRDASPPVTTVRTVGLTSLDWVEQVSLCTAGIASFVRTLALSLRPEVVWLRPVLLAAVVLFFVGLDLAVANKTHVRRVEVGPGGVRFVFLLHQERADWAELRPAPSPARFGDWGVYRVWKDSKGVARNRGIAVTIAQARAILAHPQRPRWSISERVAASLGVKPE